MRLSFDDINQMYENINSEFEEKHNKVDDIPEQIKEKPVISEKPRQDLDVDLDAYVNKEIESDGIVPDDSEFPEPNDESVSKQDDRMQYNRSYVSSVMDNVDSGKDSEVAVCQLRDIPRCLVNMAKSYFPKASNSLAVSAFLYANRNRDLAIDYSDVPDEVKEYAKIIERRSAEVKTSNELRYMTENIRRLNKTNDDIVLALAYLIYDNKGFSRDTPAHPGDIDFYDPGIQHVIQRLETISDKLRDERNYQKGKRKNMYGSKG